MSCAVCVLKSETTELSAWLQVKRQRKKEKIRDIASSLKKAVGKQLQRYIERVNYYLTSKISQVITTRITL